MTQNPGMLVRATNPDGSLIGSAGGGAVTVTSGTITAIPFNSSSVSTNTAPTTSPAATTTIATIASGSLPAGTYSVAVTVSVGGTTAAGDVGNLTLAGPATTRLASGVGGIPATFNFQYVLNGSTALTVATVAAGNAGSVYGATIVATRVE